MIHEDIYSALQGLVGGRVFPQVAPEKPATPYIIYMRVVSTQENTLASGQPIQQTRLQVDIYDTAYNAVQTLANRVRDAMMAASFKAIQLAEQDQFEAAIKLHRVIHDYSIWHYE